MASPATPLFWEEPEINLTTSDSLPNFSRHITSLARPATPHTTPHDFRKTQHSPFYSSSPDTDYKRIRRKPSLSNLSAWHFASSSPVVSVTDSTSPPRTDWQQHLVRPPASLPSSAPTQDYDAESPSLSSTLDTIQSSPSHSPTADERPLHQHRTFYERVDEDWPIRSKRKFPNFKPAKRLPQCGGGDGIWCVYAAVIDNSGDFLQSVERQAASHVTTAEEGRLEEAGGGEEENLGAKRNRSVRFAGVWSASEDSGSHSFKPTGLQRDTTIDSTFTLSKFNFPTPPEHLWEGTFESPAILHYRGASFDVVNPHASLLLGTKDFETPAEIDGLLDDYFNRATSDTPHSKATGRMSASYLDQAANDSSGRRVRTLYGDADSARRNIMRLQSGPTSATAFNMYHEPPAANRDVFPEDESNAIDMQRLEEGLGATGLNDGARAATGTRASSVYPHSAFSDQFDLHVSDDEEDQQANNIDAVVTAADPRFASVADTGVHEYRGGFAEYDEGAHAQARTTIVQDSDSTLGHILNQYEYTHNATDTRDDEQPAVLSPYGSPEQGRAGSEAQTPRGVPPTWSIGYYHRIQHTATGIEDHGYFPVAARNHEISSRLSEPPDFPAPLLPVPVMPPPPGNTSAHPAESTDLPTSEQTYGQTNELLQITPRQQEASYPPYPGPEGDKAKHSAGHDKLDDWLENKENIPPFSQTGIPAQWSNVDLPRGDRVSRHGSEYYAQPVFRSSSHYLDDEADWEDTQASESHANVVDGPNRVSMVSYADTSDDDSDHGTSILNAQGQPSMYDVPDADGTGTTRRFGNKAHRVLMDGPNDPRQGVSRDKIAKRAKELFLKKLMSDHVMTVNGQEVGSPSQAEKRQKRREAAELEQIRQQHSDITRSSCAEATEEYKKRQNQSAWPSRPKRAYHPQNSFDKIVQLSMRDDTHSRSSESRGLLHGSESPYGQDGLQYSETTGTFQTTPRAAPPPLPDHAVESWTPLPPRNVMMSGGRGTATPASTIRTVDADEYEMIPLTKTGRARPAMRSQTSLRHITIGGGDETPTPRASEILRRALTDDELIDAEARWNMRSPLAARPRLRLPLPINATVATESTPRLLSVEEGRYPDRIAEQDEVSGKYFIRCAYFPPLALAFGLGRLDNFIKKETDGRVTEMKPKDKFWAKYAAFPLGVICYAVLAIAVTMVILGATGLL